MYYDIYEGKARDSKDYCAIRNLELYGTMESEVEASWKDIFRFDLIDGELVINSDNSD